MLCIIFAHILSCILHQKWINFCKPKNISILLVLVNGFVYAIFALASIFVSL